RRAIHGPAAGRPPSGRPRGGVPPCTYGRSRRSELALIACAAVSTMTRMSQPSRKLSLTGIQSTGDPHLGNLVGAIRPALKLAESYETMYFIADFPAVNAVRDPQQLQHNIRSVAATWLAAGLDPSRTIFYRQSAVPEIFELNWVLSCVTGKGLLNRA